MTRKSYSGAAPATAVVGALTAVATSFVVSSVTGYPTGSAGPFVVCVDRGLASEEKILITSVASTTFTVAASGRGYDGTTATTHAALAVLEHVIDANTINEANDHVNTTSRDDHTQYLNTTRHDVTARHAFGAALGTPGAAAAVGTTASAGTGTVPSRSDHVHIVGTGAINASAMFAAGVVNAAALATAGVVNTHYILVASNDASAAIKTAAGATYTCDGTNDEVQIRAAMVAIQALVDDAGTSIYGGEVVLSAGVFNIGAANQIDIPANTTLRGTGGGTFGSASGTTLRFNGTAPATPDAGNNYLVSAIVRFLGTNSTTRLNGQRIVDIGFDGVHINNVVGLYIHFSNAWHLDNLRFFDCVGFGIYIVGGSDGTIKRTRFDYCGSDNGLSSGQYRAALELNDDVGGWANDNIIVDSCWWEQCKDRAVTIRQNNTLGDTSGTEVAYSVTLINCKFENSSGNPRGGPNNIYVRTSGTGLRVINCYFFLGDLTADSTANRMAAAINASGYYGVWIQDNQFVMNTAFTVASVDAWILLSGGEGAIVTGNRFEGSKSPTTAQIKWTGSNTRAYQAGNYVSPNSDAGDVRVLSSGTPTTVTKPHTGWYGEWDQPWGLIASGSTETVQSAIAPTAEVDFTSLTAALPSNWPANRRIRITVMLPNVAGNTANDSFGLRIKESTTTLQEKKYSIVSSLLYVNPILEWTFSPTAGAHTYKAAVIRTAGTGTTDNGAQAGSAAMFSITDIGNTGAPA